MYWVISVEAKLSAAGSCVNMNYPCVTILLSPCSSPPYVFIKLHFCPVSAASFSVPTLCATFCLEPSFVCPPSLQCPDLLMTCLPIFTYPPLCVPFLSLLFRLIWIDSSDYSLCSVSPPSHMQGRPYPWSLSPPFHDAPHHSTKVPQTWPV